VSHRDSRLVRYSQNRFCIDTSPIALIDIAICLSSVPELLTTLSVGWSATRHIDCNVLRTELRGDIQPSRSSPSREIECWVSGRRWLAPGPSI